MSLLAMDPGVRAVGWARFRSDLLEMCGCSRASRKVTELGALLLLHQQEIPIADLAVVETMEYHEGRSGSVVKDLLNVQWMGGALAGSQGVHALGIPPSEWKGSLPKDIHHKRIAKALSPEEWALVDQAFMFCPVSHHKEILDAIGIGLFRLGRIDRAGRRT